MQQVPSRPMPKTVDDPITTLVAGPAIDTRRIIAGAESLVDAALQLDVHSSYLRRLASLGWGLDQVTADGVIHLVTPENKVSCWTCGTLLSVDDRACAECDQ